MPTQRPEKRHVGWRQHRHLEVLEGELGLRGQGGGFAGVIVAGHRQHAALGPGAGEVGVLEHVAGAVDPGRLAVPHAEHAIELSAGKQVGLLRAPDRRRREVLVHAFLEHDVAGGKELARAVGLLVEAPQRRAAIAGEKARGLQSVARIEPAPIQQDAHQRLDAGDENSPIFEQKLVVKRDFGVSHSNFFPTALSERLARTYKADVCPAKAMPVNELAAAISIPNSMERREKLV